MVKPRNLNDQYFGNLALKINLKVFLLTILNDQHVTHQHENWVCVAKFFSSAGHLHIVFYG